MNVPDWASKIKHTPQASTRSFAWYFLSPRILTSLKWTSLQPNETPKKLWFTYWCLAYPHWLDIEKTEMVWEYSRCMLQKLKFVHHGGGEPQVSQVTYGHPTYHANVIKLKIWEIIWTGRFPYLSGLTLLPGVPHLHVNRPVLFVSLYLLPRARATIIKTFL